MKKTILVIASNPKNTSFLRLDKELRILNEVIQKSALREAIALQTAWAARTTDLLAALKQHKPWIVHFCGHGEGTAGLILEDDAGKRTQLSSAALTELSSLFGSCIEGILLNACYSQVQAVQMAQHINYVIGMNRAIADKAALAFTRGFYTATCDGEPIPKAFKFGKAQISIEYPHDDSPTARNLTPVLFQKETLTPFNRDWIRPSAHPPAYTPAHDAPAHNAPTHTGAPAAKTAQQAPASPGPASTGQHQSNTVSGITFGNGNATFNFSPVQTHNSHVTLSTNSDQGPADTSSQANAVALLALIEQLSQTVSNDLDMNALLKQGALAQIEHIASELQTSPPDHQHLQKMIGELDQGLQPSTNLNTAMGEITRLFQQIQREGYDA